MDVDDTCPSSHITAMLSKAKRIIIYHRSVGMTLLGID